MSKLLFLAWLSIAFLVLRWANAKVRAHEQAIGPDRVGLFGAIVPMGYAYTMYLWPMAIPLGAWLVARRPDLARQGRISLCWGLGCITANAFLFAFWRELWLLIET